MPRMTAFAADASMAGMAKLKPFFDKKYGNITAANSSQITDGAAWLILASEDAVKKWNLKPLGKIVDSEWAGLDPAQMGLGPVHAATPILQRHGLGLNDLDAWEINEAFAAQVMACRPPGKSDDYCREQLGLPAALGALDDEKAERRWRRGGDRSSGRRFGSAHRAASAACPAPQTSQKRGIATICIGGGLGGAMLVEPCSMKHWQLHCVLKRCRRDPGRYWTSRLRATNALSAEVLGEFKEIARPTRPPPAQGPDHPFRQGGRVHRRRRY
jgi:acetyl-CoA C-acetyltransferase